MRGKPVDLKLKEKLIQLRTADRLSFGEINKITGVNKSTLSSILKLYPINGREISDKLRTSTISRNRQRSSARKKSEELLESKFYIMAKGTEFSRHEKAKIAESAILFRLCLTKFIVYGSPFDGDKADWIIEDQDNYNKTYRIQVKWVKRAKWGQPMISLQCVQEGKSRRYLKGEFDFIVGYDFKTDNAYIYSFEEVSHIRSAITVSKDAIEAWHKLRANK